MRETAERREAIFDAIQSMVMLHSPSGAEGEIDQFLNAQIKGLGLEPQSDAGGNIFVKIPGAGPETLAITAHKDEIGAIVTSVQTDGRVRVRQLGGSYPWVYGEGVVDLIGDHHSVVGVLSFGSRHVSHASPQFAFKDEAPLRWADVWIETKLGADELAEAGVRPGSRMVIGKHRKAPIRIKDHIASYTLDNKASLAILLELARRIKSPRPNVYLVATAKEEVGAVGARYFTQRREIDALIALEICPLAPEYSMVDGVEPVLIAEDSQGVYDDRLNQIIRGAAGGIGISLQMGVLSGFGSDGSCAMKAGHVARAACLGFPTQNTHGYEIAHLGAIANCIDVLAAVCQCEISPC